MTGVLDRTSVAPDGQDGRFGWATLLVVLAGALAAMRRLSTGLDDLSETGAPDQAGDAPARR